MELILRGAARLAAAEGQVGGKAAGLARLEGAGARVPPWVAVSAEASLHHLGAAPADARRGWAVGLDTDDIDALGKLGEEIAAALVALPLAEPLLRELRGLPAELLERPVAVRSSMIGEDSAESSFAGQLRSFLYCCGVEQIADALRGCWASAYSRHALVYRRRSGAVGFPRVGVVVQEMVTGEVSGVAFSSDPVTGRRDRVRISAAWGLGEGVVSGLCNTDEVLWSRRDAEVEYAVADKDRELVPRSDGGPGTEERAVDAGRRSARSLSAAAVEELAEEVLRVAEAFGGPQDVEWTRRGEQLFLLQARPVTSLPPPEAVRGERSGRRLVFDNSNIQESYCGVTTPLTFSFARRAYASVYEQTMRAVGLREPVIAAHRPMLRNLLGLVRGRVYYNIENWYRGLLLLPSFGRNKADMEAMMGLTDPVDLVRDEVLTTGQKLARLPGMLRTLLALLWQFRRLPRTVPAFLSSFEAARARIDRGALAELPLDALMERLDLLRREMLENWSVPILNDFYVMMTSGALRRLLEKAQAPELLAPLMAGEDGIESTEPTRRLMRMARDVRGDPRLAEALRRGGEREALAAARAVSARFGEQVDAWIDRYGDRCMGELKLETISLREDPSFVAAVLRGYLDREDLDPDRLADREKRQRAEAEAALAAKLSGRDVGRMGKVLARAREAVKNRENMRLARTRMFGLYRDVYRAIGDRLWEVGRLDAPRDVFYLAVEEIEAYYDGTAVTADLAGLARLRRAEFAAYEAQELPHQFQVRGAPYDREDYAGPASAAPPPPDAELLSGIGCYPGIVEAPLRVIHSPRDELDVGGRILCTVRTDPGWAPLFPTCAGILVERGSTLSHSAVVARELGIPAVVGVPGLLQVVRDGERVRLDGGAGTVTRLEAGG